MGDFGRLLNPVGGFGLYSIALLNPKEATPMKACLLRVKKKFS